MAQASQRDLQGILTALERAARSNGAKVSVGEIVETLGPRSFGPLLLIAGLLGMTPVSAIPTAPTILAVVVILIAGQLALGRDSIWIPRWLAKMSVRASRFRKAMRTARKPARVADRVVRPRLTVLTGPIADRIAALACVLIALCVPPLELLPFVAFFPSLAIFAFGLALVARDGVLVAIALAVTVGVLGFAAWRLFG